MNIYKTAEELRSFVTEERKQGHRIAFVPTMGALHEGHLSLVRRALKENDCCIVSVFVNPTQFNNPRDLETYPRTLDADSRLLASIGTTALFAPEVETIYPEPDTRVFHVGAVAEVMEGKYRPGHFNGVMQVVSRLFDLVQPDCAYFGEKDFQQIAVLRAMAREIKSPVEIIACPIVREEDGLARSSRNTLLSEEGRAQAPNIYRILSESRTWSKELSPKAVIERATQLLDAIPTLRVEYFEIVDADTLQPITRWEDSPKPHGCITVYCGEVRLIDNIAYY
ncbi:pantoate--beta-alanine ligase [Porphyromonas catoniae]|jgi:pantoate--beta-alanine ligase|uniref:Pantothenate synthetase n=1 Tax=Porphyromonas catoniae ATCC 51270 TaxID=887901 RepID=Z4WW10_9PORP|nr:pantoate--beta-alanine ligase [Porphyromonas catoniae]EWC92997.1 pantoate--beta-alanine ligase [Porphyromonas catoniae ATCC 51270]